MLRYEKLLPIDTVLKEGKPETNLQESGDIKKGIPENEAIILFTKELLRVNFNCLLSVLMISISIMVLAHMYQVIN